MWCPDNYLRLVNSGRKALIYNKLFCIKQDLETKGGYNAFYIFGVNYLSLYDEYLESRVLKKRIYEIEKYKLFRYYLMKLYYSLVIFNDKKLYFNVDNSLKNLLKNYHKNTYFYFGILYLYLRSFIKRTVK